MALQGIIYHTYPTKSHVTHPLYGGEKGGLMEVRILLDTNGDEIDKEKFFKELRKYIEKVYYVTEMELVHGKDE